MKRLLIFLLLLTGTLLAQQPCPVEFTRFHHSRFGGCEIYAEWKNVSGKTISAIGFDANHINVLGESVEAVYTYTDSHKTKDGQKRSGRWNYALHCNKSYPDGEMWVRKVVFEDGSEWKDDGSHACRVSSKK